ncbi:FG-GAP repeat domain-containing protein [Micromonospora parva]|uniref:FG-GAP repeat domain-containing protein n=1 Tax=Micromonospora parva TaxID=1464048 RepID=A0ABW6VZQ8_9ACTN|nr:VCBS repeat-containing protein [Micromonospora parva]
MRFFAARGNRQYTTRLIAGAALSLAVIGANALLTISPAEASSINGPITRTEMLDRAQNWVDRDITYTQTGTWAKDVDGSHTYRRDCSGLVSMAWHLSQSYVTDQFQGSNAMWTTLGSINDFQPGDAMVRSGHIELFAFWKDKNDHSKGAYVYSFNSDGQTVQNPYANNNTGSRGFNGWDDLRTYKPIRRTGIEATEPTPEPEPEPTPVADPNVVQLSGDFNGDGRDDAAMLYLHKDSSIELFTSLANASGGFGAYFGSYKLPANSWKWNSFRTIVGDFNGDGRSDLGAMYYQADGSITMHTALANTSGGFGAFTGSLTVPASAAWKWDAIRLTSGDFNGDGRDDAAMLYHHKDDSIELFTSLGTTSGGFGTFTGSYKIPANAWTWDSFRTIAGDYNGDGRSDLAAMYYQADGSITMHTALANTSGGFGAFTGSLTVPASAYWKWDSVRLTTGDFNGDGRDDAGMLYRYKDESIELFTSLGNASGGFGSFTGSYKLPANSWKWGSFKTITGDHNGDGRSDVAAMYYQADGSITMHTALANTSGGFGAFTGSLTVPASASWYWDAIRLL